MNQRTLKESNMKYSQQIIQVLEKHKEEMKDQILEEDNFLIIATMDPKDRKVIYFNAGDKSLAADALSNVGHQNVVEAAFFEMISNTIALATYRDIIENS